MVHMSKAVSAASHALLERGPLVFKICLVRRVNFSTLLVKEEETCRVGKVAGVVGTFRGAPSDMFVVVTPPRDCRRQAENIARCDDVHVVRNKDPFHINKRVVILFAVNKDQQSHGRA